MPNVGSYWWFVNTTIPTGNDFWIQLRFGANFLETSNSSLFSIQTSSNAGSTGDVTGTQNTDTRENSGPNIAAIVGGAIGGLIALVLLSVAGLLLGRRQWEIASTSNPDSDLPTDTVPNRRGKEALPDRSPRGQAKVFWVALSCSHNK